MPHCNWHMCFTAMWPVMWHLLKTPPCDLHPPSPRSFTLCTAAHIHELKQYVCLKRHPQSLLLRLRNYNMALKLKARFYAESKVNIKKYHLPEPWVRIVFNELWGIFNPNFFNQCTTVSQGADFKVDEIVLVRPLWILSSKCKTKLSVETMKKYICWY